MYYFFVVRLAETVLTALVTDDFLTDPVLAGDFSVLSRCDSALPAADLDALLVRLSVKTFDAALAADFDVVFEGDFV
jgi:hypothetical protein